MLIRIKVLSFCLFVFALSSCGLITPKDERGLVDIIPTAERDRAPEKHVDLRHLPDAVPRYEERTIAGNKSPYMVKGLVYRVMEDPKHFEEVGIASWYGEKFHGNTTSNNEIYNMYAVTGAHKTLPIPSYVRVTNLENNKSIVVRINDRGPFAPGRVVDLSYAGAQKLGYINAGTAKVKLEYIDTAHLKNAPVGPLPPAVGAPSAKNEGASETPAIEAVNPSVSSALTTGDVEVKAVLVEPAALAESVETLPKPYLQIGAYFDEATALTSQFQVASHTAWPVVIDRQKNDAGRALFRVQVGPFSDEYSLQLVKKSLIEKGLHEPLRVVR